MLARTAGLITLATVTLTLAGAAPATAGGWLSSGDVSSASDDSRDAAVGIDDAGNTTAAWWIHQSDGWRVVASTKPPGGPWGPTSVLSLVSSTASPIAVDVNGAGDTVVAWFFPQTGVTDLQTAYRPRGGVWATNSVTSASGLLYSQDNLTAALDDQGTAVVGWTGTDSLTRTISQVVTVQPPNVADGPVTASGALANTFDTQVGADGGGNANIVFDAADHHVYSVTRAKGANWTAPVMISAVGENASGAASDTNAHGDTVVAYVTPASGGGTTGPWVVRSVSRMAGGPWSPPVTVSAPSPRIWETLDVALNARGDALLQWSPGTDDASPTWGVTVAARPAGGSWQAPAALASGSEGETTPTVAVQPDGGGAVLWSQYGTGNVTASVATRSAAGAWSTPHPLGLAPQDAVGGEIVADATGNMVAMTRRLLGTSPTQTGVVVATSYDGTSPLLGGLAVPASGLVGVPVAVSVAPTDSWSKTLSTIWKFGDGGVAPENAPPPHLYTKPGTYTVTVSATDAAENVATARPQITVTRAAVDSLRIAPSTFKAAKSEKRTNASSGGTAISYHLALSVPVRLTVERATQGRRSGGSCVKATRRNRRKPSCTKHALVPGSVTRTSNGGNDRFRFSGRLSGRKLSPGSYRLNATPRPGGYSGAPVSAAFRIRR